MLRGEVRLSCSSWARHEAIFGSDVDTGSKPQTVSWARFLGLLSSDLSNSSVTNGPQQQEARLAFVEGEQLRD